MNGETPTRVINAALGTLWTMYPSRGWKYILDPGSGTGQWGKGIRNLYGNWPSIAGVEINESHRKPLPYYNIWLHEDFREFSIRGLKFDLVVGTPPEGEDQFGFVHEGFELLHKGGVMMYLLKTDFLEQIPRCRLLINETQGKPKYVFVSSRPIWEGQGSYSLFIWEKSDWKGDTQLGWFDWRHFA